MTARQVRAVVRVVIYARISQNDTDTVIAVGSQEAAVRQRLDETYGPGGWVLVASLADDGISAWSGAKRPNYDETLRMCRAGEVDCVAVWSTDRLYRLMTDLETIIQALGEDPRRGIDLISVTEGDVDLSTSAGRLKARIMAAVAQHESDHKSERIQNRADQAAGLGWAPTSACYGYRRIFFGKLKGATLEIVEEEATILRHLAGLILDPGEPCSLGQAAALANSAGMLRWQRPVKGSPGRWVMWDGSQVRRCLTTPTVAGLIIRPDGAHKGNWQPIFDRARWDQIQAELQDPQRRNKRAPGHDWLRPILTTSAGVPLESARLGRQIIDGPPVYDRRVYRSPPNTGRSVTIDAEAAEGFMLAVVGEHAHLLRWEPAGTLAPTAEGQRITDLEQTLAQLNVDRVSPGTEAHELLPLEYQARRAALLTQLKEAQAHVPQRHRQMPAVEPGDLARRWALDEGHREALAPETKQRITRWAIGPQVLVLPSGGGRYGTRPAEIERRLVIASGPLREALAGVAGGHALAGPERGRPSAR